jgi:hypothetical protein
MPASSRRAITEPLRTRLRSASRLTHRAGCALRHWSAAPRGLVPSSSTPVPTAGSTSKIPARAPSPRSRLVPSSRSSGGCCVQAVLFPSRWSTPSGCRGCAQPKSRSSTCRSQGPRLGRPHRRDPQHDRLRPDPELGERATRCRLRRSPLQGLPRPARTAGLRRPLRLGQAAADAAKTTAVPIDLIHEASATFAITVLPRRHSRRR